MLSINNILLVLIVIASIYAWNNPYVMSKWIFNPYDVSRHKQWYRFITSGFIHKDYMHLGFNLYALYAFGTGVEQIYGTSIFGVFGYLLLFILGVIASSIPTFLKHKNNPAYNSLGASGGISSVVFACIFLAPKMKLNLILIPFFKLPGFAFGALYMIYSHFMAKKQIDNINHDAHLYGALFGILFTLLYIENVFFDYFLNGRYGILNNTY